MGSSRIDYFPENKEGEESPSLSYHEIIDRLCPDYLAMGMTWDEYWNGDPEMVVAFRKAHELKRKQKNYDLWLQGMYIYEALADVSPLFHAFVKDPKPIPYSAQPYALDDEEAEKRKKNEEEDRDKKNQETVKAWAERVNRLKAKKGAQTDG